MELSATICVIFVTLRLNQTILQEKKRPPGVCRVAVKEENR